MQPDVTYQSEAWEFSRLLAFDGLAWVSNNACLHNSIAGA